MGSVVNQIRASELMGSGGPDVNMLRMDSSVPPRSRAQSRFRMSHTVRTVLMILVSIGILAGVVAWVGFDETVKEIKQAGWTPFLALGAMQLAVVVLQTLGWGMLNRPANLKVSAKVLFEANLVGYAVNVITPSAYLGGEPAKVLYAGRKTGLSYTKLAGTVVLAKYMEAISFFLFFTTATIIALVTFRDDIFSPEYIAVGMVLMILGTVLLAVSIALWLTLMNRGRPLSWFVGVVSLMRRRSRFFAKLRNRTRKMEDQVNEVFNEHPKAALKVFGVFLLAHIVVFVRPAVFVILTTGGWLTIGQVALLAVAAQGLLAFQVTPGSAGTLDAGMLGVFSLIGLTEPTCAVFLLFTRFFDTLIVGFGMYLGGRVGAHMLAGHPKGEEVGLASPEEE